MPSLEHPHYNALPSILVDAPMPMASSARHQLPNFLYSPRFAALLAYARSGATSEWTKSPVVAVGMALRTSGVCVHFSCAKEASLPGEAVVIVAVGASGGPHLMHDLHMRTINGSSWRIQFPRRIEYRSVLGTARVAQRDVITNRRFHLIEYLGCGIHLGASSPARACQKTSGPFSRARREVCAQDGIDPILSFPPLSPSLSPLPRPPRSWLRACIS